MTDIAPYGSAEAVIADRARWSVGRINELVQRARREGWLEGEPVEAAESSQLHSNIESRMHGTSVAHAPLYWLCERLGLSETQLDTLWLLACIELSPAVARLVEVFGTGSCSDLSVQILLELVPISSAELRVLHQLRLVEMVDDARTPNHRRAIRANDRVIELARGELELDRELGHLATVETSSTTVGVSGSLVASLESMPPPWVVAIGNERGATAFLVDVASRVSRGVLRVRTRELPREPHRLDRMLAAISREARLFDLIPLFEDLDSGIEPITLSVLERELSRFPGPLLATANAAVSAHERPVVLHQMPILDEPARRARWTLALGPASIDVIEAAASRYVLGPGAIVTAARNARAIADGDITTSAIHTGVRAYFGDRIGSLASRIETRQTWSDLVLPRDQLEQVVELVARVRHRSRVLDTWGFGDKVGKGNGVAALFSGPPGTGKTMIAGLIAKELGLDLYQVDLSKVVSKYIGETEKSLAALFDAAEAGHAIVLFDEADSLFAKRTEVKSSNDRYANLEVNYLLQRIEAFTGIALLTTNHESSIDEAFRRRLAIHVRFPNPDETQRVMLWEAMMPERAAVSDEIDYAALAKGFDMSGGYIKNAVLRAAFLAAEEDVSISMRHLWSAARSEYERMGKVVHQGVFRAA